MRLPSGSSSTRSHERPRARARTIIAHPVLAARGPLGLGERGEQGHVHARQPSDAARGRAASATLERMLSLDGVLKTYGPRTVLRDVSLIVPDDARIGVVGPNGIGKSTLLRVLAGLEEPDEGRGRCAPPAALRVGCLPTRRPTAGRRDAWPSYLARRTGVAEAERAPGRAHRRPGRATRRRSTRYSEALERFLALGGDDLDARAGAVLRRRGPAGRPPGRPDARAVGRPGGPGRARGARCWRASTCSCSTSRPTTSTSPACDRSSASSTARRGAVVTVSHDRAFLDRMRSTASSRSTEPSHERREYAGGWSDYVAQRDIAREPAVRGATAATRGATPPGATACAGSGQWAEEGVKREKKRPKDPRQDRPVAMPRRAHREAGRRRCAPPSGRSSGWRRSTSRGRAGGCSCGSRPGAAAARWWPCWRARSCSAARSGSARSTSSAPRRPRRRRRARTAAARRTLLGALLGRCPWPRRPAQLGPRRRRRRDRPGAHRAARTRRRLLDAVHRARQRPARGRRPGRCWPSSALGADHVDAAGGRPLAGRAHPRPAGRCSRPAR